MIDPIKLLKKWKYVLIASGIAGFIFGIVIHVVWARTFPFYKPTVMYEALPPQQADLLEPDSIDQDAMEQFMATEAGRMLSPTVLERVVRDPRLLTEAPKWSSEFRTTDANGLQAFDYQTAMKELADRADARPQSGTSYIKLTVTWWDKNDATALAGLLREAYLSHLNELDGLSSRERRDSIQRAIDSLKQDVQNLTERRARLIRDEDVSSISEQSATTRGKLQLIARDRNELLLQIRMMEVQLEQMNDMIKSESGVRYSDTQRATAQNTPIILGMKRDREQLETRLNELRRSGIYPSHREYKRVERQIAALEQQISVTMERELANIFSAEKDQYEMALRAARAQEADLVAREEVLETELQDLTRTIREINDLTNEIAAINKTLADRRSSLADLETTSSLASSARIIVVERERIPDTMAMPKIFMMIPLGVFLITGLTAGTILASEFFDQRLKSTSDLAAMSRTKILGSIPLATEDPTASGAFETVVRDADRSVVAESFRQISIGVLKAIEEGGHKTCLVFSGTPGAGSTSVIANLGVACSRVDRRVLLIDANFRRPALHRIFGLPDSPGLGDILSDSAEVADVIREVPGTSNLFVLTAGTPGNRAFEQLNTSAMTKLLAQVGAEYDAVFVDTAPAIVAGDAKALAQRCDATILVARALTEKRGMVARIKNEFSDSSAAMLGVILNAVRSAAGGYMKRNIRTSTAYHADAKKITRRAKKG